MNRKAVVENCDYHLLETVPSLTGQEQFVLCEDGDGNKFVCPEELWLSHAPQQEALAPVHAGSTSQEKIDFFLSLFRGRDNLYAKRYYKKTGKSGYVPACQNEWIPGTCDKKAYRCPECPNRAFKPLTVQTVRAHLIGRDEFYRDVVGIYPMLENDRTWLLAVDFDEDAGREDTMAWSVPAQEMERMSGFSSQSQLLLQMPADLAAGCSHRQWPAAMNCGFNRMTGCFPRKISYREAVSGT